MTESRRVIVFRNRLQPGVDAAYGPRADEMYGLVTAMPGFLDSKDFIAEDGERVAIIEFASAEELAAWRDHQEHQRAQAEGRDRWYSEYKLQVCALLKESKFAAQRSLQSAAEPIDEEGGCHCRAVRYRVRGAPFEESFCHCTDCRRSSGAPVLAWATFRTAEVEWSCEPKIRRSSERARRGFCGECGAQLSFYTDARPEEIDLTLASLDRPEAVVPRKHIFAGSKIEWLVCADGLPQHERWARKPE
jgi:heme-degrading monooxygenase HmoA